jgi:hypothetical protein
MSHELTAENYQNGFLVDDELMASVTAHPSEPGKFLAYVLRHSTGEYLGMRNFDELTHALNSINQIKREWKFEKSGGCGENCGDGNCGKNCSKGSCAV